MSRPYIFCPTCQTVRAMSVTLSLQADTPTEAESDKLVMQNYHCETCHTFVMQTTASAGAQEDERVVYYELEPSLPMI